MKAETQQYLIHATGWATWEIGQLRPASPGHKAKFRQELQGTLMVPDGVHLKLAPLPWALMEPILNDPTKCQSTHYWMAGTQYQIYAITDEGAEEVHAMSRSEHDRLAAKALEDEAADRQWEQTMGQLICPACGTVCYGDCGKSPRYR